MIALSKDQHKIVENILRQYAPNQKKWIFGSRAKQTAKPHSDLDLCLLGDPLSTAQMSALRDALSESNLPFRVDIVQWNEISEDFQAIIKESYIEF